MVSQIAAEHFLDKNSYDEAPLAEGIIDRAMKCIPWSYYAVLSFVLLAVIMLKQAGGLEHQAAYISKLLPAPAVQSIEESNSYFELTQEAVKKPNSGIYDCNGLITDKPKGRENCQEVTLEEKSLDV